MEKSEGRPESPPGSDGHAARNEGSDGTGGCSCGLGGLDTQGGGVGVHHPNCADLWKGVKQDLMRAWGSR